jgi:hypothetical protein
LKRAGLGHKREDPFVFHDLRHTFGTLCRGQRRAGGRHPVLHGARQSRDHAEIYMHFASKHDAAQRLTEAFGPVSASTDDVLQELHQDS